MNCDIHTDVELIEKGKCFKGDKNFEMFWCTECREHKHIEVK